MTIRLDGKIILVAGASQGMGRVSALRLAEAGAHVIVAARRLDVCEAVADEIRAADGSADARALDAGEPASVAALGQWIGDTHGRLDAAFNNVGKQQGMAPLHEIGDDRWQRSLAVNLSCSFYLMRAEVPLLRAAGGGAILNNSSAAGLQGVKHMADYAAVKWGLIGLTKSAAIDYGRENIRVNVLAPGMIRTEGFELLRERMPDFFTRYLDRSVSGRFGEMDDVAHLVVWLMSDQARYLSGMVLPVDGGEDAQ